MGDVCEACYGLQSIFNIGFICEIDIIPIFTQMGKPTLKSGMMAYSTSRKVSSKAKSFHYRFSVVFTMRNYTR